MFLFSIRVQLLQRQKEKQDKALEKLKENPNAKIVVTGCSAQIDLINGYRWKKCQKKYRKLKKNFGISF